MKRYILLLLAVMALTGVALGSGRPAAGHEPAVAASRDLTDDEVRMVLDRVFRARVRETLVWTDSLASECGGRPRYHLMRARLLRELIPVDDEQKEVLKRENKPLFAELDRVIAYCDARMEAKDPDPALRLYRGWAWMMMSHVHTYEKSFWSAGREAKKGKEDLQWYLQKEPDDAVASALMGAFLYFADTLPTAYKFVSKLFFLPSGDRDHGLRMMELVRGSNSFMEIDNSLILCSVYLGFEGQFEEGLEGFEYLRKEFPDHATFLRPEAIMHPFLPRRTTAYGDSLDAAMARISALPANEGDQMTNTLIRFERACADRFFNPPRAIERFERIVSENPKHPDWVPGFAAFELGCMMASRGNAGAAREYWDQALGNAHVKYLHADIRAMRTYLDQNKVSPAAGPADVAAIYYADEEARAEVRRQLEATTDPTIADMFYLGEAWLLSNDTERALTAYTGALNPKAAPWEERYQLYACARAAEILGSRGDYTAAAKHYERAGKFWRKEYLYDWILEARKRYFQGLAEGKDTPPPTLLTTSR
jgi:tetratricopeptide (TPR) repeat protein